MSVAYSLSRGGHGNTKLDSVDIDSAATDALSIVDKRDQQSPVKCQRPLDAFFILLLT